MISKDFVEQLYTSVMGRSGFEAGVNFWTEQIETQNLKPQEGLNAFEVVNHFFNSPEFVHVVTPLAKVFHTVLGRFPDVSGYSWWLNTYRQGMGLDEISNSFLQSDEFKTNFGELNDTDFLTRLYQNAFDRNPDESGKTFWLEQMYKGMSRSEVAIHIAHSSEFESLKGQQTQIVLQYQSILGVNPTSEQISAAQSLSQSELTAKLFKDDSYGGLDVPYLNDEGVVVDGYVAGATVFIDLDGDGIQGPDEPSQVTDAKGNFDFGDNADFGRLIMSGGTDISTGKAFEGEMTAPAGSTVVNPMTTLVDNMTQNTIDTATTTEQAVAQVKKSLGLDNSIDILNYDPIKEASKPGATPEEIQKALNVQKANVKVNTLVKQTASLLKGAGATDKKEIAIKNAYASLGEKLEQAGDTDVDLTDPAVVSEVIKDSSTKSGASEEVQKKVEGLSEDASKTITNFTKKIDASDKNTSKTTVEILNDIASVQIVAKETEDDLETGGATGDVSQTVTNSTGTNLDSKVDNAGKNVGDVDGDGDSDPDTTQPTNTGGGGPASAPDTTPPVIAINTIATDDVINSTEDNSAVIISGTTDAEDGQTVTINADWISKTATASSGSWNVSLSSSEVTGLNEGMVTITADVDDAAGNSATQASSTVIYDATAPTVAINTVSTDNKINTSEDDSAVTISGSSDAEDNQTVSVSITDGSHTVTKTATVSGGAWSTSIDSVSNTLEGSLAMGDLTITADVDDAAGNSATQATQTVDYDKAAPAISTVTADWGSVLNSMEDDSAGTVTVSTSGAEDGQTVTVSLNGSDYTGTISSDSAQIAVSASALQALTDGSTYTLTANVSDAAGNAATANTATTFSVDTNSPSNTFTGVSYNEGTDIITLTGTNMDSLLEGTETSSTDIKTKLDWTKLSWNVNGNNSRTVDFSEAKISSAKVTGNTSLEIVLDSDFANAAGSYSGTGLESAVGSFDPLDTDDTVSVTAGFSKDAAGNAATTDAFSGPVYPNKNIVVFDLVNGKSSAYFDDDPVREFLSSTAYDIYIIVDSDSKNLVFPNDQVWTGGANLDANDRIILVGNDVNNGIIGKSGNPLVNVATKAIGNTSMYAWNSQSSTGVALYGVFPGLNGTGGIAHQTPAIPFTLSDVVQLWSGAWVSNPNQGHTFNDVYLNTLPTDINWDWQPPSNTFTSVSYNNGTDTLTLTGTNMNTLLDSGEDANTDIQNRLDWTKFTWTSDAPKNDFSTSDIDSVKATDDNTLTIVFSSTTNLESSAGFDPLDTDDTVTIAAGFSKDAAGNAATTDAFSGPDWQPPTNTFSDASYDVASNTLTLTGANMNTLLESDENSITDIKDRMDWSKITWNADVVFDFSLAKIETAKVTNDSTLSIVLTSAAAEASGATPASLEYITGFDPLDTDDTVTITAGFSKDAAGNAATTDVFSGPDWQPPSNTFTSVSYNNGTDTLTLTGTNMNTLLDSGEDANTDIQNRLDWTKFTWTSDAPKNDFSTSDIDSVKATDDNTLTIVFSSTTNLESSAGFDPLDTDDTVTIAAGFSKDAAGNVASTDAFVGPSYPVTVLFDMVAGTLTGLNATPGFQTGVDYDIYIRVDSDANRNVLTSGFDVLGGSNLGSGDKITLIGDDNIGVIGMYNNAVSRSAVYTSSSPSMGFYASSINWYTGTKSWNKAVRLDDSGNVMRGYNLNSGNPNSGGKLWTGTVVTLTKLGFGYSIQNTQLFI